ncbi:TRP-domain-containing protein [Rhypophila decipiens]|uniref:TRP-domain-containing protein n=1 Tax=Rhypophila decipiens TaxID=261697 RepID=A0AAN6Y381_9PEZI|nr:TRP-domain-containing protein [Rhypophila decipiens]
MVGSTNSAWTKMAPSNRIFTLALLLLSILLVPVVGQDPKTQYVYGTDAHGVTRELPVNRYPALYTGNFGDCLGGESLFNITKFDAAYYADNLTIVFHLDGTSNIRNESLMMQISVDAYGSNRFQMVFDPCLLNIYSLCPLNASVPVTGWAVIPVGPQQIGGIPPIAFDIPDFEGSTTLKIFANSSQTQIGCFQAVMRNGNTFSHPEIVAPILGVFILAAIIASFSTATYGFSLPHIRMHYAHSLSVFVVWEILQSIFFSGALSVEWPSVCVAWWSNFAWSAGLINVPAISNAVNAFVGVAGNSSQVGGAGSVVLNNAGGLITQIYGRSLGTPAPASIMKRDPYNASDPFDYTWAGEPVGLGLPTPGTWYGFWGNLAGLNLPAAAALVVGLIWLVIAIALVAVSVILFKFLLELLSRISLIKNDRMSYFRSHWLGYLGLAVLRTVFISFFMVMLLTIFQFTNGGTGSTTAVAGVTFVVYFIAMATSIALACRARTRLGRFEATSDRVVFHRARVLKIMPGLVPAWESTLREQGLEVKHVFSIPLSRVRHVNHDSDSPSIHQDQAYTKKFGWLSARYRRSKWWFFSYYAFYLFGRAAFLGAGVGSPLVQVYGLLIYEIIAFAVIIILRPFEGTRNNALAAWMLSISKILTTGLSVAFLPEFNIDRIIATAIGVVIIVIQGLLIIGMMILVCLSAMSSWMSLSRNREEFKLDYLDSTRVKYFEKMESKAADEFQPRARNRKGKDKEDPDETLGAATEPSFSVLSVHRNPKIEDEDEADVLADLEGPTIYDPQSPDAPSRAIVTRASRANSVGSRYSVASLPRAGRPHQSSVSSRDFAMWNPATIDRPDSSLAQRLDGNGAPSVHFGDESDVSAARKLEGQSSYQSLRSPTGSRPGSPFSPGGRMTPSRETLARYAEERTRSNSTPIPDIK